METISRADLILADEDAYTQQQFERRRRYAFPNETEVYLASPEDVVVSKLRWVKPSSQNSQQYLRPSGILALTSPAHRLDV